MTEEGMEYDQHDYNQLPGLFDMETVASSDRNNVTLLVQWNQPLQQCDRMSSAEIYVMQYVAKKLANQLNR